MPLVLGLEVSPHRHFLLIPADTPPDGKKKRQSRVEEYGALSSHPPEITVTKSRAVFYIEDSPDTSSIWSGPISYHSRVREDGVIVTDSERAAATHEFSAFDSWPLDFAVCYHSTLSDLGDKEWVYKDESHWYSSRCVGEGDRCSERHEHPITSPERELSMLDASHLRSGTRFLDWFEEEPGSGMELPFVNVRAMSNVDVQGKTEWK
jgi:hypothetical protein